MVDGCDHLRAGGRCRHVVDPGKVRRSSGARAHRAARSGDSPGGGEGDPASAGTAALDTSGCRRAAPGDGVLEGDRARGRGPHRGGSARREGSDHCATDSSSTAAALEEAEARSCSGASRSGGGPRRFRRRLPDHRRNEQQHAAGLISSQAFDGAKAVYNATRASHTVKETAVSRFARAAGSRSATTRTWSTRPIRRHSYRQGGPAGRDRLTLVRQQRFRAHRHRNDRRHGIAGSRGRRQ